MIKVPAYPRGDVVGPCVCGSWPGGKCLKCRLIVPSAAELWSPWHVQPHQELSNEIPPRSPSYASDKAGERLTPVLPAAPNSPKHVIVIPVCVAVQPRNAIRLGFLSVSQATTGPRYFERHSSRLFGVWGLFLSMNLFGHLARGLSASRIHACQQAFRGIFEAFHLSFGSVLGHVEKLTEESKGCPTKEFPKTEKMFPRSI
jgi:hypothetical protein